MVSAETSGAVQRAAFSGLPAPIALFAYKRPDHTRRALDALASNPMFLRSELHVVCDAARSPHDAEAVERTRAVVRTCAHPRKTIIEATENQGLARSIVGGVSSLCDRFGRVIVVEDDLLVAPSFLDFMNRALERYEETRT